MYDVAPLAAGTVRNHPSDKRMVRRDLLPNVELQCKLRAPEHRLGELHGLLCGSVGLRLACRRLLNGDLSIPGLLDCVEESNYGGLTVTAQDNPLVPKAVKVLAH